MGLFKFVKQYKNKLEKRFTHRVERIQVNFRCDPDIYAGLKGMAEYLTIPLYVLIEHTLQLGAAELAVTVQNRVLREQLCHHLVQDHLLVPVTQPEPETTTRQAVRLKHALVISEMLEVGKSPSEVGDILKQLLEKVTKGEQND